MVVIGGGVIGLAAAYYLAQAGKRVTLVERRGIGQEASGANVGLVTLFSGHSFDEPDPGPVYELTRASIDAYASLGEELGVDIEYEQCGGVVYAQTDGQLAVIRRAYEGYRAHGVPVEWLDARGIRECEPAFFSERVLGGVFCPLNGQINPLMLCRAFARGARRLGARIMLGTTVQNVYHGNGRVRAVRTSEGDIPCEFAVNAAGAWAADIGEMVGQRLPVTPARGQIVLTEPLPRFIHRVISGAEPSARQTRRGNVIIGEHRRGRRLRQARHPRDHRSLRPRGRVALPAARGPARDPRLGRAPSRDPRFQAHHPALRRAGPSLPGRRPQPPRHLLCRRHRAPRGRSHHRPAAVSRPRRLQPVPLRRGRAGAAMIGGDAMEDGDLRMAGVERGRALGILVDGAEVRAYEGESIAAALVASGRRFTRWTARTGEPRGYFCGMGVCQDCLVTVDGLPNVRACVTPVRDGMRVESQRGLGDWRVSP